MTIQSLAKALVKAQSQIKAAGKSGDNKFDKYSYAKLEDFMEAAKPVLSSNGLAVVFSTPEVVAMDDRTTKNGGAEHAVRVRIEALLIHESGETLTTVGWGEGQDRADKSIYKAITGAKKYALAGLLSIPTSDDPESDETVGLSNAKGSVAKVASVTGEIKTKMPDWSNDQKTEIGLIFKNIYDLGGKEGEREVQNLRNTMKYDAPSDVIDAANTLLRKWQDINDQGKP